MRLGIRAICCFLMLSGINLPKISRMLVLLDYLLLAPGCSVRGRRKYILVGFGSASMLIKSLPKHPGAKIQAYEFLKYLSARIFGKINLTNAWRVLIYLPILRSIVTGLFG